MNSQLPGMPSFTRVGRASSTCLALALLMLAGGCARGSFDPTTEAGKLLQRDAEWVDAAAAGKDVEKIVSYWSDDALVIEPGQPVYEGKAAIRAYVVASLGTPGFKTHWVSRNPVFSQDGTMAWMRGEDEISAPGPDGKVVALHLRGVSIWRRDTDGVWRCVVDIANAPPAAAP